jgi:hypothetical protein
MAFLNKEIPIVTQFVQYDDESLHTYHTQETQAGYRSCSEHYLSAPGSPLNLEDPVPQNEPDNAPPRSFDSGEPFAAELSNQPQSQTVSATPDHPAIRSNACGDLGGGGGGLCQLGLQPTGTPRGTRRTGITPSPPTPRTNARPPRPTP